MKTRFLCLIFIFSTTLYYAQVTEEWVRINTGNIGAVTSAMTTDEDGNVYLTGSTNGPIPFTGTDFVTIKYNSAGVLQWEATYNGTANGFDGAKAIAVDPQGNVFVTGDSPGAINGISSGIDYLTIKYDSQGNELWVQRYHGNYPLTAYSSDVPWAIAADEYGNVYVTGQSVPTGATSDYGDFCTVKYSSDGNLQWVARFNSGQPGYRQCVKVSALGNVYVFGHFGGSSNPGGTTIKYNSSGQQQWAKSYSDLFLPRAMEIDSNENAYVTGQGSSIEGEGFHTLKYNSAGDSIWTSIFTGPSGLARPSAIAVDDFGNVYVTGSAINALYTGNEYATVKYNASGQEQWSATYYGLGYDQYQNLAEAIALDATNNVYVTGRSQGADYLQGDAIDFATVKYNSAGVEQWAARYHRPQDGNEHAIGIRVGADGKVYVSGNGTLSGEPPAIINIKYAQSPSDVSEISSAVPENFMLSQNYPNPFNPSTQIQFAVSQSTFINLTVYDILGKEVATLVNEEMATGTFKVEFSAKGGSASGGDASTLSSGIYFYKLQAGSFVETKKMILMK